MLFYDTILLAKIIERSMCMNAKCYKQSQLKHQMYHERAKGKDVVVRKLRPDEVEYLSQFCMVEPFLYELKMNFPPHFNPQNASGVVKGLYFEFRKNRRYKVIKELKAAFPHLQVIHSLFFRCYGFENNFCLIPSLQFILFVSS